MNWSYTCALVARNSSTSGSRIAPFMRNAFVGTMKIGKKLNPKSLISMLVVPILLFGYPSIAITTAQTTDFQAQLVNLESAANQLKADQPAAFLRLHGIISDLQTAALAANPSSGLLMVGASVSVKKGASINFPISLIDGTLSPSGIQCELVIPTGLTLVSLTIGPAASAAGKTLTANGSKFLVGGLNQTTISKGVLAIARFSVATSAILGFNAISLINPAATDKDGNAVPIVTTSGIVKVNP